MEEIAGTVARFALDVAIKATLLLGLTALALVALSRASAAVRQMVATLGLAGALALPVAGLFAPTWRIPLLPAPLPERAAVAAAIDEAPLAAVSDPRIGEASIVPRESEGPTADADSSSGAEIATISAVEPSASGLSTPAAASFRIRLTSGEWVLAAVAAWGIGLLFSLLRLAIGSARVVRLRRNGSPADDESWAALVARLSEAIGLSRRVEVLFTPDLAVPVTAGLTRPVVLLPEGARRWNDERRRVVLLHELAHVRRADWVALFAGHVAGAVYWFHPLAWSLRSTMRKDCERACDDLVLAAGTRPSVYAAHLLSIIRSLRLSNQRALSAVAMARRSYWDGRMRAILDPSVARGAVSGRQARFAAVALFGAVALLAVLSPWAPVNADVVSADETPFFEMLSGDGDGGESDSRKASATKEKSSDSDSDCDSKSGARPAVIRDEKARPASKAQVAVQHMIEALQQAVPQAVESAAQAVEAAEAEPESGYVKAGRRNKDGGSWYGRGMDLHKDGRYDEAIAAFERAIADGDRVEAATYNIACGYALKGDADRAFEWLEKAMDAGFDVRSYLGHDDDLDGLRSDPRYAQFQRAAREKEIEDKRDEAGKYVRKYERLRSSPPKSGGGFYEVGKELLDVGRYDLAAQAFVASAERGYKYSTSLYNAACAFSLGGDRARALDYLHKSLEAGFDDPNHLRRDEDLDNIRGEPRYRELLKMADDLELHRFDGDFGDVLWKRSRSSKQRTAAWREVEEHFADYTRRHPESGRAWFNLGYARIEGNRPAEAAEAFRRAVDLDYRKSTSMYNLACAYSLQDRRDEAFDWLFKAMDSGFEGKGLLRSDDDLDNLRGDARFRQALSRIKDDWHDDDD